MENINLNVLNYIVKDINLSVARLGINTQLSVVEEKDYAGNPYLKVCSTPFQTMPVMFKDITLEGNIYVEEDNRNEDAMKVTVRLNYRYHYFDGGSNGHPLGDCQFTVDKDYWKNWDGVNENWASSNIYKIKGLAI